MCAPLSGAAVGPSLAREALHFQLCEGLFRVVEALILKYSPGCCNALSAMIASQEITCH